MKEDIAYFATSDYRQILTEEFERRRSRNPRYSLRAFARDIGLKPFNLSDILNERCGMSRAAAVKVSRKLGFSEKQTKIFSDIVDEQHGRSYAARAAAAKRLSALRVERHRRLSEEQVRIFTDWKILSVLQLVAILPGALDREKIATRLQIDASEVAQALDLLEKHGLIVVENGCAHKSESFIRMESAVPNGRIREFHKSVAQITAQKIETVPMQERKNLAAIFCFDKKRVSEARDFVATMQDEFLKKFANDDANDSVYLFSQNFVRLDHE